MTSGWEGPRSDTLHCAAFFFLFVFAVLTSLFPLFFSSCFLISFHPPSVLFSLLLFPFFSSPSIFPFPFHLFTFLVSLSLLQFPLLDFTMLPLSLLFLIQLSLVFLLVSSLLLFFHPFHQFPVSSWLLFHLFLYAFLYFSHFTLFLFLCFLWHLSSCFILSLFLVSFPLFLFFTVPFPFLAPSSFFPSVHRIISCLLALIWSVHFLPPCLLLLVFSDVIKQTIFGSLR